MVEAASYPTSVTAQLYQVVARKSTTTTADIDSLNTNLAVTSTSGFPTISFISVNNETMLATVVDATNFTISRAYAGSAAAHSEGDSVKLVVAAASINRIINEIVAIETYVGTSGGAMGYVNARYLNSKTEAYLVVSAATYLGGITQGQVLRTGSTAVDASRLTNILGATFAENDIEFTPDAFNVDNANPASAIEIDGDADQPRIKKIEFGNTDYSDLPVFKMPRTYDGNTLTWSIMYCSSTASGVFDIGLQAAIGAVGTSYNPVYGSAVYFGNITASASTGIVAYTEKSIAAVSLGLTNNALNYLRVLGGTTCAVQILNTGIKWDKG